MKKITPDEMDEFLRELSALTRKHKITIGGCGCCGSPFLDSLKDGDGDGKYMIRDNENLRWKSDNANI